MKGKKDKSNRPYKILLTNKYKIMMKRFFFFIKLNITNLKHGEEIMEAIDLAEKLKDQ